ncbi:hypothetical protein [Microlunatus ginsengisoli]|uniref:Uncharacterized protein n=1 Tax=Microlunatus ginsengisoli TaxID=363863 RepID=A0ABP6ZUG1_9ACTN
MTVIRIRDKISLTPGGIINLDLPPGGEDIVLVAREIVLGGGRITDRPVTLVAEVLTQVGGIDRGLTLSHSAPPQDSITLARGTVEPDVPVTESQQAAAGKDGFALTAYVRTLRASTAVTLGQGGGRGRIGRDEIRNACQMVPDSPDHPCRHLDIKHRDFIEGPPGGPGVDGQPGGQAGSVVIHCVSNGLGSAADWRGRGGAGGEGGEGGKGGKGAGFKPPPGDDGADGEKGATPADKNAVIVGHTETDWYALVAKLPYAPEWARFRAQQLAHILREHSGAGVSGGRTDGFLAERAGAARLPVVQPPFPLTDQQFVDVVDENGVEFDLEIVPEVSLYDSIRRGRAAEVEEALVALSGTAPGAVSAARDALKAALASLLGPGGSFLDQGDRARGRRTVADLARADAAAAIDRCARVLGQVFGGGASLVVPGLGPSPTSIDALALAGSLASLIGTIPPAQAGSPVPSVSPVSALPARPSLAVSRAHRTTAGPYEPGALPGSVPALIGLAQHGQWPALAGPTEARAVDLVQVAAQLRQATGPRPARDLIVELAEAVRTWLLADLRIEQAGDALAAVDWARATAQQALADLGAVGNSDFRKAIPVLMRAGGLAADAIRFHSLRAQRAARLYTLSEESLTGFGARSAVSDPDLIWSMVDRGEQLFGLTDTVREQVTALLASDADEQRDTYTARGTFRAKQDAGTARLKFVAPDLPPDPQAYPGSAEVFARLRSEEAGFWFDAALADIEGAQSDAKVTGATVTITFDSAENARTVPVTLTHQGFSSQLDLNGALHTQSALPATLGVVCVQAQTDGTETQEPIGLDYAVGSRDRTPPEIPAGGLEPEPTFPAYGRGVVAGWRLVLGLDSAQLDPSTITMIEVELRHESLQEKQIVNLLRVELATQGLAAGSSAPGRVTLTGEAPTGGLQVLLSSSDPAVLQVPSGVLVPAGERTANFSVKALKASGTSAVRIAARTADGVSRRARIPVRPALPPAVSRRVLGGAGVGAANCVVLVPGTGSAPDRLLVTVSPPKPSEAPSGPLVAPEVHLLGSDLSPVRVGEPGELPRAVSVDPTRSAAYVVLAEQLVKLDLATLSVVATAQLGFGLVDVCCAPTHGVVFVSDLSRGRIHVLSADDLSSRQILGGPLPGPANPLTGVSRMALDGDRIVVARGAAGLATPVAAVTEIRRQVDGTWAIGRNHDFAGPFIQPVAVAVDPVRGWVYVSSLGNPGRPPTLTVHNRNLLLRAELPLPGNANGLAVRPHDGLVYVASQGGTLLVDGPGEQVLRIQPTGPFPYSVAVNSAGSAYVADLIEHTVSKVETPAELKLVRLA